MSLAALFRTFWSLERSVTRSTLDYSTVLQSDDLCGGVSVVIKPDKHSARENVSKKHGNDLAGLGPLNIVKDCVAGFTDRTLQRRLRDTHRNNTHRRVVTNGNKEKPLVIFETDDMVFVYNPEGRAFCGMTRKMYWFAKQDSRHMLQEEMDFLQKLRPGD